MNKMDFSLNIFVGKVGSLETVKKWYRFVGKIVLHPMLQLLKTTSYHEPIF